MSDQPSSLSRNGVLIRLPDERWQHIIEEHPELEGLHDALLSAVSDAERVFQGGSGELLTVKMLEPEKAIVAVYREIGNQDGFVITAFVTRRLKSLERRMQLWPPLT